MVSLAGGRQNKHTIYYLYCFVYVFVKIIQFFRPTGPIIRGPLTQDEKDFVRKFGKNEQWHGRSFPGLGIPQKNERVNHNMYWMNYFILTFQVCFCHQLIHYIYLILQVIVASVPLWIWRNVCEGDILFCLFYTFKMPFRGKT